MLLVGIPFIEQAFSWLLPHILGNFNVLRPPYWVLHPYWHCPPDYHCLPSYVSPFLNTSLYLLGIFYFQVRRLGRATLSLVWALAFAYEVAVTATYLLLLEVDYLNQLFTIKTSGENWTHEVSLAFLLPPIVLIWFARQASRISFSHALVLIVLSLFLFEPGQWLWPLVFALGQLFSHLVFTPLEDVVVAWEYATLGIANNLFVLWVLLRLGKSGEKHEKDIERWIGSWDVPFFGVTLRQLAIRVLPRFDPARGINKELLVALYGLYFLPQVYATLRYWDSYRFDAAESIVNAVIAYAYTPLWLVPVIALTYAVRVREPREGSGTVEPKARPT